MSIQIESIAEKVPDLLHKEILRVGEDCVIRKPFIEGLSHSWDSLHARVNAHSLHREIAIELGFSNIIPDATFKYEETEWGHWIEKRMPYLTKFRTLDELTRKDLLELPLDILVQIRQGLILQDHIMSTTNYLPDSGFKAVGHYINLPQLNIQRIARQDALGSRNIGIGFDFDGKLKVSIDTDCLFSKSYFRQRHQWNVKVHLALGIWELDRMIEKKAGF